MQHGLHNKGLHNSKTHPRSHRYPSPSGLRAREAEGTTCRGPGAWDAGAVGHLCSRLGALTLPLVAAAPALAPLQSSRDPLWPGPGFQPPDGSASGDTGVWGRRWVFPISVALLLQLPLPAPAPQAAPPQRHFWGSASHHASSLDCPVWVIGVSPQTPRWLSLCVVDL